MPLVLAVHDGVRELALSKAFVVVLAGQVGVNFRIVGDEFLEGVILNEQDVRQGAGIAVGSDNRSLDIFRELFLNVDFYVRMILLIHFLRNLHRLDVEGRVPRPDRDLSIRFCQSAQRADRHGKRQHQGHELFHKNQVLLFLGRRFRPLGKAN
ncbi:MAG: hypothetical protein V8Q79_08625 [Christensenellales bacterium]